MRHVMLFLALMVGANFYAQVTQEIFESFKLQERRDVQYYFPENLDDSKKYPLILVLDANYLFDQVVAVSKFSSNFHGMPESIVVGVNQSKDNIRLEDCAFNEETGLPEEKAKLFFEFLGMELIPYLDLNYSTAPFKMVFGYDITANFQNYWLFKNYSLFNAYINISPTLAPEMEERLPARLNSFDNEIFYQLIVEGEKNKSTEAIVTMDKAIKALDKKNLHYNYDVYDNADHTSIVTYGIGKAFDNIFSIFKPITPVEYKSKILTSEEPVFNYLESKYQSIETIFGISKPVDLNDIMAIYAASRKKEEPESLKSLADLCKKQFPETMLGFFFEGEYYEQIGEAKKAIRAFGKAFLMKEIDFLTKDMALEKIDALKSDFGL